MNELPLNMKLRCTSYIKVELCFIMGKTLKKSENSLLNAVPFDDATMNKILTLLPL